MRDDRADGQAPGRRGGSRRAKRRYLRSRWRRDGAWSPTWALWRREIPARGGVGSVGTLGVSESLRGPEMRRISVEDAQRSPKSILDSEGAQKGKFLCDAH